MSREDSHGQDEAQRTRATAQLTGWPARLLQQPLDYVRPAMLVRPMRVKHL